ncbi:hypothetical protein [Carp edema virus]|nr:hypothetical protein [Carp edema virus]
MVSLDIESLSDLSYIYNFLKTNKIYKEDEGKPIYDIILKVREIRNSFLLHDAANYHKFSGDYNSTYCFGKDLLPYIQNPQTSWAEGKLPIPDLHERVSNWCEIPGIDGMLNTPIYIELYKNEVRLFSPICSIGPYTEQVTLTAFSTVKSLRLRRIDFKAKVGVGKVLEDPILESIPNGVRIHLYENSKMDKTLLTYPIIQNQIGVNAEKLRFHAWLKDPSIEFEGKQLAKQQAMAIELSKKYCDFLKLGEDNILVQKSTMSDLRREILPVELLYKSNDLYRFRIRGTGVHPNKPLEDVAIVGEIFKYDVSKNIMAHFLLNFPYYLAVINGEHTLVSYEDGALGRVYIEYSTYKEDVKNYMAPEITEKFIVATEQIRVTIDPYYFVGEVKPIRTIPRELKNILDGIHKDSGSYKVMYPIPAIIKMSDAKKLVDLMESAANELFSKLPDLSYRK